MNYKKKVRTLDLESSPDSSVGKRFSVIFDFFLFLQLLLQVFAFSQFRCELSFPNLKYRKQVKSVKKGEETGEIGEKGPGNR
jgi:hypothetical protein